MSAARFRYTCQTTLTRATGSETRVERQTPMYESFYGLRERPFDLALNPRRLLLTPQHREALGNLEYGILTRNGVTLLLGEAGTGKTTLIRTAFVRAETETPGGTAAWAYLRNPTLQRGEFLEFLAARFGLSSEAAISKIRLLDELERALLAGKKAVLIIDEAQSVPLELLEEVRLLANIESDSAKLLPVILAGQPELADRLNEPGLRQLKQRIALRFTLVPFQLPETAAYIAARIDEAGGTPARVFTREAVLLVHQRSGGIPRTINVICENALLTGYVEEQRPVGREVIEAVCRDFDLWSGAAAAAPISPSVPEPAAPEVTEPDTVLRPERGRGWAIWRRSS
jgi:general secretion pathway protein A